MSERIDQQGGSVAAASGPVVLAVLTSFNRQALTLRCLAALAQAALVAGVRLRAVLVDDGSTDGTAQAVRAAHGWVHVIEATGNLYWNRGMHQGMAWAMQQPHDHLLWLNDDTTLRPDALARLLSEQTRLAGQAGRPVVLVGATAGADGQLSYGGGRALSRLRPFRFTPVWDAAHPVRCDAMNGNCVLLPAALVKAVGNIDPAYEHAMGDTDYALRAARAGFEVYVASGIVGDCSNNTRAGTFHDASLPLRRRWAVMMSRKGLPWRSWLHFTRKHGGALWPLHFAWPYLRVVMSSMLNR